MENLSQFSLKQKQMDESHDADMEINTQQNGE